MGKNLSDSITGIMAKKIDPPSGKKRIIAVIALAFAAIILIGYIWYAIVDNRRVHYAPEFHIKDIKSPNDADGDGIDDYADMVRGALDYIATKPKYESKYYKGGYPNDGCGVCTDVIWHAFAAAGYCLKDMIDTSIAKEPEEYLPSGNIGDPNIDFRRVRNLKVFFELYAENLTTALYSPDDWMPGDIVVFDGHIAICSDKRNASGIPYIIHHGNPVEGAVEADDMARFSIAGHYRYNGGHP
ncbi:MAG: DUF1287 domain-containing protein [Clostridia bacterium]|nr:DUF1287 domain-containing protein [Clostridia bacterium]